MSRKKINPRRRPATQADVKRAKDESTEEAMRLVLYMVLYVLVDKHSATHEDVNQFAAEVNYVADSINRRYLKWQDIMRVLNDEYDVQLELR